MPEKVQSHRDLGAQTLPRHRAKVCLVRLGSCLLDMGTEGKRCHRKIRLPLSPGILAQAVGSSTLVSAPSAPGLGLIQPSSPLRGRALLPGVESSPHSWLVGSETKAQRGEGVVQPPCLLCPPISLLLWLWRQSPPSCTLLPSLTLCGECFRGMCNRPPQPRAASPVSPCCPTCHGQGQGSPWICLGPPSDCGAHWGGVGTVSAAGLSRVVWVTLARTWGWGGRGA